MKITLLLLLCNICFYFPLKAQLNVELLHQLVEHSKEEYDRQHTLRGTQMLTTANQEVNMRQTAAFKSKFRDIQQRFQVLSQVLLALSTSTESAQLVQQITQEHTRILQQVKEDPSHILLALNAQVEISQKAQLLAKYILGLLLSLGELNQMKQSDRRILYSHVVNELKQLLTLSRSLANALYYAGVIKKLQMPQSFPVLSQNDKRIVEDILSKINQLSR